MRNTLKFPDHLHWNWQELRELADRVEAQTGVDLMCGGCYDGPIHFRCRPCGMGFTRNVTDQEVATDEEHDD